MRCSALGLFVTTVAVVLSFGAGAPGAPVPKHLTKNEEPDLGLFQGQWKLTQLTLGGQAIQANADGGLDIVMEFRGGALVVTSEKQDRRTTAPIKLDAKATPPRLTWSEAKATNLKGEAIKDEQAEKPCVMLYKFEADTLVLAVNVGGDQTQPPKGFGGKDGSGVATMTFTRVKK